MKNKRNLIKIWLLGALLLPLASGAQQVTKISAGSGFSLFVKSDGSLWAMGYNGGAPHKSTTLHMTLTMGFSLWGT